MTQNSTFDSDLHCGVIGLESRCVASFSPIKIPFNLFTLLIFSHTFQYCEKWEVKNFAVRDVGALDCSEGRDESEALMFQHVELS